MNTKSKEYLEELNTILDIGQQQRKIADINCNNPSYYDKLKLQSFILIRKINKYNHKYCCKQCKKKENQQGGGD
jgi:hypothetical protein